MLERRCQSHRSPTRTSHAVERRIDQLRRRLKLGTARIGCRFGSPPTAYRVLRRLGLHCLAWLDRPTGRVMRRCVHGHPATSCTWTSRSSAASRPVGGWQAHGRGQTGRRQRVGYAYIHSAVDDHSRLASSEVLADE